jgi:hypothetical protein
LKQIWDIFGRE